MTREETVKVLSVMRGAYPGFYRDTKKQEAESIIALWSDLFAADDVRIVLAAVRAWIESDEKGFPPVPGQIKSKIRLLTQKQTMTEQEAWNLVAKAVKNGIYGAQEEFDALPPTVRRVVGSANILREWARMDTDTVHSVVASNFQRSYKAISAREQELKALPQDVQQLVSQISGGGVKMLNGVKNGIDCDMDAAWDYV